MGDLLGKLHQAGLTLKAGCGIGCEFSTLRPRQFNLSLLISEDFLDAVQQGKD